MELIEVDGYELPDLVLGPHGRLDHRALGIGDIERHPDCRQRREYVREQDDAVGREGAPGLQSDLDDEVRFSDRSRNEGWRLASAWYSAMYRPACRIIQAGGRGRPSSPRAARTSNGSSAWERGG